MLHHSTPRPAPPKKPLGPLLATGTHPAPHSARPEVFDMVVEGAQTCPYGPSQARSFTLPPREPPRLSRTSARSKPQSHSPHKQTGATTYHSGRHEQANLPTWPITSAKHAPLTDGGASICLQLVTAGARLHHNTPRPAPAVKPLGALLATGTHPAPHSARPEVFDMVVEGAQTCPYGPLQARSCTATPSDPPRRLANSARLGRQGHSPQKQRGA